MVDKTLILKKVSALEEYLKQIGEYAPHSLKDYAEDWEFRESWSGTSS